MDDLYQEFLLELAEAPLNHGELSAADSHLTGTNSSCGDQVEVWIKWEEGKVGQIGWIGQGCIISQAAMSALSEYLKGKTKAEVADLHLADVLQLLHFDSISPGRLKCVSLGLETVKKML